MTTYHTFDDNLPAPSDCELPTFAERLSRARVVALNRLDPLCAWEKFACQCSGDELAARTRYNTIKHRQQAQPDWMCDAIIEMEDAADEAATQTDALSVLF